MTVRTRAARAAASALIAGALLVGTTGCSFITPTATLNQYDPSDGVGFTVSDLELRNVLAISNDDESAVSLMITIVNPDGESGVLTMQYESAEGDRVDITKPIPSNKVKSYGTEVGGDTIVIADAALIAGQLFPVYFQFGDGSGKEVLVPVIAGDNVVYSDLAPASALTE